MRQGKTPYEIMGRAVDSSGAVVEDAPDAVAPTETGDSDGAATHTAASVATSSEEPAEAAPRRAATFEPGTRKLIRDSTQGLMDRLDGMGLGGLWDHAATPLTFLLPRGVVALIGLGLLFALVISFWIGMSFGADRGHQRGYELAANEISRQMGRSPRELGVIAGGQSVEEAVQALDQGNRSDAAAPQSIDGSSEAPQRGRLAYLTDGDPRQVGLNYLHVGAFNERDTVALAEFFADQGVDVAVVPTENGQLFRMAVMRSALEPQQAREGDAKRVIEREVIQVLRLYEEAQNFPETIQDMLYWARHRG